MITIEAYRARIGCFCGAQQGKRKSIKPDQNSNQCINHTAISANFFDILWTFIIFVFILTLKFNINMTFLKLSMLLIDGDVESYPGPTTCHHLKSVSGTFHQVHLKFGDTAGIQCSCNALCAICFLSIKSHFL